MSETPLPSSTPHTWHAQILAHPAQTLKGIVVHAGRQPQSNTAFLHRATHPFSCTHAGSHRANNSATMRTRCSVLQCVADTEQHIRSRALVHIYTQPHSRTPSLVHAGKQPQSKKNRHTHNSKKRPSKTKSSCFTKRQRKKRSCATSLLPHPTTTCHNTLLSRRHAAINTTKHRYLPSISSWNMALQQCVTLIHCHDTLLSMSLQQCVASYIATMRCYQHHTLLSIAPNTNKNPSISS